MHKAMKKRNVTASLDSLDERTFRKAKLLAAQKGLSISGLLAQQIESLVEDEEDYRRSERQAAMLLDQGFCLGGVIRSSRDECHDR
jgi:hypothetical protein